MMGFLARILGQGKPTSSTMARQRLESVVGNDRVGVSGGQMLALQEDMVGAVARYLEVDREGVQVSLERDSKSAFLVARFPVMSGGRRARGGR